MKELILNCECIFDAEAYPKDKLLIVDRELTVEELEWYDVHGWDYYSSDYLLPVLGDTIYLSEFIDPVVEINGKRWKITFDFDYRNHEVYEVGGKRIVFKQTDEPLTVSDCAGGSRHHWYMKLFGQPVWIQTEHYPAYKGKPCCHLATIETRWGDSGNFNILIACDDQGDPAVAFFEASCC